MSISSRVIYLDSNATTPVMPLALEAARAVMEDDYGNPSSVHSSGLQAKAVMEQARATACDLLGCSEGKLLFVSGATEGIQTAVFSALLALREKQAQDEKVGTDLLYGATEHKAVPESLHHWNTVLNLNFRILAIPVDNAGRHDLKFIEEHIQDAGLICTMAANNETGVITDLVSIENLIKDSPAYWLVDGVQALGKLPLKLNQHRIDYSLFSGHKLYAPKGIGMLYVHKDAPFTPLLAGGGQESSLRSGTENVSGIAALGAVMKALGDGISFRDHATLSRYRLQLLEAMRDAFPGLILNASLEESLPTTLNFSVPGLTSKEILDLFDAADVRVSAGSACSAAKAQPSFVLQAMALPEWQAASAVRVSFGPATTQDYIDEACKRVRVCGEALRKTCMVTGDIEPLPADGVMQLSFGAACTWIIANAATKECVVIDPLPELIERIAKYMRCQHYSVKAVLATNSHPQQDLHNSSLIKLLADAYSGAQNDDPSGFYTDSNSSSLESSEKYLSLGKMKIRKLDSQLQTETHFVYLYGSTESQIQFAFCGDVLRNERLSNEQRSDIENQFSKHTLICVAHDFEKQLVSRLESSQECKLEDVTIPSSGLNEFLRTHPGTVMVDVREPYEQQLSHFDVPAGTEVLHVPLSRLANGVDRWLRTEDHAKAPLLFFCRTGGRSSQAVQCLRRLGYANAWHIAGGLALWQH
ncbi:aminotransferase class V-fold PLP-dependent enzyme [Undibacterium sp. LX40W]|uniref:Aminotransferase class V-fold PLP-dependent enzyme n=1 Tax=Undibacterium nitidum TaxID=2762298 RepID=A0A923HLH7_9BURK|nr:MULTISPECIES: aminotransferase class V-fold PLP-dependent enzyme [Undibacterium]MBC3880011.1 aminotransferase class V-fold PLP-dependent enzyme [Undibacterium nitidum]MBC3891253.1 aminotransferase class V-fold PLP-dependent enzyme [Undibacterium sp. LX40W]